MVEGQPGSIETYGLGTDGTLTARASHALTGQHDPGNFDMSQHNLAACGRFVYAANWSGGIVAAQAGSDGSLSAVTLSGDALTVDHVRSMKCSADGSMLYVASQDANIIDLAVFDVGTGGQLDNYRVASDLAASLGAGTVLTGSVDLAVHPVHARAYLTFRFEESGGFFAEAKLVQLAASGSALTPTAAANLGTDYYVDTELLARPGLAETWFTVAGHSGGCFGYRPVDANGSVDLTGSITAACGPDWSNATGLAQLSNGTSYLTRSGGAVTIASYGPLTAAASASVTGSALRPLVAHGDTVAVHADPINGGLRSYTLDVATGVHTAVSVLSTTAAVNALALVSCTP